MDNVRTTLDRLIRERGEDYAALSRLLGRNPAYVQQFIHRGSPRRLAEADRQILARYLGVSEAVLGGPPSQTEAGDGLFAVPQLTVAASAGPGALAGGEQPVAHLGFDLRWLKSLTTTPRAVSMITVRGDSMQPTLQDGDDILVDQGDAADRLRDGIYVLRIDEALLVKRLARHPASGQLSIRSDNPAYPDWQDCDPAAISVIGRVIWAGRRFA
ncbi:MAG: helix-turn-helix transcriptional regulator [Chakrabartia sp.]